MLRIKQIQKQKEEFVNPFGKPIQENSSTKSLDKKGNFHPLHHLQINFPKFTEECGVSE